VAIKLIDPVDVELRKAQFKRPRLIADRKKLRKDRIDSARGGVAHVSNLRQQNESRSDNE